jgi:glyoxylase-like metal-dependent hydrolase (beta-lactamase superfamily II)
VFFEQLKPKSDNFSYILADEDTREAAVVDTSFNANEIMQILKNKQFKLKYIICTHGHPDHVAGNMALRSALGGLVVGHNSSRIRTDIKVEDGDILKVGNITIKALSTPGHTPDSICLLVDEKMLLTGDTLFVGECGRTDLAGGNPANMHASLFNKILKLNDEVAVFPGHDYGSSPQSSIGIERRTNYTLQPRSVDEFIEFMKSP